MQKLRRPETRWWILAGFPCVLIAAKSHCLMCCLNFFLCLKFLGSPNEILENASITEITLYFKNFIGISFLHCFFKIMIKYM